MKPRRIPEENDEIKSSVFLDSLIIVFPHYSDVKASCVLLSNMKTDDDYENERISSRQRDNSTTNAHPTTFRIQTTSISFSFQTKNNFLPHFLD